MKKFLLSLALLALAQPAAWAQNEDALATTSSIVPKVERAKSGAEKARALKKGASIYIGDKVRTRGQGVAAFVMADGSILRLAPNSELRFDGPGPKKDGSFVGLLKGLLQAAVSPQGAQRFHITTDNSVSAVKGTELQVEVKPEGSELKVLEGQVELSNNLGGPATAVAAGEASMVSGESVSPPRKMNAAEMASLRKAFAGRVFKAKRTYQDRVKNLKGGN